LAGTLILKSEPTVPFGSVTELEKSDRCSGNISTSWLLALVIQIEVNKRLDLWHLLDVDEHWAR